MMYVMALIPAFAWGSIGIITAKMGGTTEQQTIGSMTGFMIFALGIYFYTNPVISSGMLVVGAFSGVLMAVANFGQFDGMTSLGVSRAVPLVAAGQLTLNTLSGAALFGEWQTIKQWLVGLVTLSVIIYGAKLTSFQESQGDEKKSYAKKGLIGVGLAIIGGGLYSVIPKGYQYYAQIEGGAEFTFGLMVPQALGGLLGSYLIYALRTKKNPLMEYKTLYPWKNTLAGFAFAIGSLFMLMASTSSLGLATAFTFSQLNLLVGGFGGIVILHEHKTKKEMAYFLAGVLLVLIGAIVTSRI
ncbi:MAG: GRP family sugar transporter [Vagococcus sp.]